MSYWLVKEVLGVAWVKGPLYLQQQQQRRQQQQQLERERRCRETPCGGFVH